jgi:hypothetical protein
MKINPNPFANLPNDVRPRPDASQARLAFEAMLSAGAARKVFAPETAQSPLPPAVSNQPKTDTLSRPGRVLDIKV